ARRVRAVLPPTGRGDLHVDHEHRLRPHAEDTDTSGALWVSFSFVMTPRRARLGNGPTGPGLVEQSSWNGIPVRNVDGYGKTVGPAARQTYFASPRPIWVCVTGVDPIRLERRHARAPRR